MNRITSLFNIKYPIIQGGMIWNSGYKLASAVSNAGGLGLIGAGSMYPEVLREHIQKCQKATSRPFGVNVPMLYPNVEEILKIIVEEGVKIVFISAGNLKTWTYYLKENVKISINKKAQNLEFLAREVEGDVLIFYTKIAISKKINTFEIFNSLLTDVYSEQQNIVHVNINSNKNSFLFTNSDVQQKIVY